MVIEDSYSLRNKKKSKKNKLLPHHQLEHIASPVDRLAAFVGEMPVFVPFMSVLLAPFRHDISVAQFMGSQLQSSIAVLGMIATGALGLIAYHTLFVYFFGATPGKYFVGLRVVSIFDGQKPSFIMCLLRAISVFLEFILLGFPWLAALSHPQRRVLHDRLSDTYVKCLDEKKAASAPLFVETQLAKNVQAPGWALLLLAVAMGLNYFNLEKREVDYAGEFEATQKLCSDVSSTIKNWHSEIDPNPTRIAVALALYEAQSIDDTCLEKEAHFSLWRNQEKDLGYLGLALTHAYDDRAFGEYIEKACGTDPQGETCRYAADVSRDREIASVDLRAPASSEDPLTLEDSGEIQRDFFHLHLERKLHEFNRLPEALTLIEKSTMNPNFADFLNLERLKIMWEMDRMTEARASFHASRAHMSQASRIQLSNWMCSAEVLNGCSSESQSVCTDFLSDYERNDGEPQPEALELNYIRAQKCVSSNAMDYISIDKKLNSEKAHEYLAALEYVDDRKFKSAKEIFKRISDQADSDEFQTQANADLVKLSLSEMELEYFFEEFQSKSNNRADPNLAFELLRKYLSVGDFEKSSFIGESLIEMFPYKKSIYTSLLSEAKKHKKLKFAQKLREQFKKRMPLSKGLDFESQNL